MTPISSFFLTLLLFTGTCDASMTADFKLAAKSSIVKEIELDPYTNTSSPSNDVFSYALAVQTSSPIFLFISGSPDCPKIQLAENSGSIDLEIPDDTWPIIMDCWNETKSVGKVYFHVESTEEEAVGTILMRSFPRELMKAAIKSSQDAEDPNSFVVSEHNPYLRKIKLQSLSDHVRIGITSENQENALEVYITFCPTNKGILYTTSYAPYFEIILKSPRMEMYYDAYSCDTNVAFFSNSSQPTSPLIIRLESQFSINGTMTVLINGAEPSVVSHVASYESGTFSLERDETKVVELKYQPTTKNIQAYLDVVSGAIAVYLSPCKSQETDMFYSNFSEGPHRVDVDLEAMMDNTTCSLAEIDPSTVYMLIKSYSTTKFGLWIPGEIATWHLIITIGLILLFLSVCMIIIIYFGRRKTGKLVINNFQR